jgi:2-haloacid dehalogenase
MPIQALLFDVFGTLADWRSTIAREAKALVAPRGHDLDWEAFADAWRAEYQPAMEEVRSGRRGFVKLDTLHAENLDRILPRFGLAGLSEGERIVLNHIWHRLDAWPEVSEAMRRLSAAFRLGSCSNGNIAIMVDFARHNGFRFDAVLGSEVTGAYKPDARAYLGSVEAFGLEPGDCMMVAAHSSDLAAAARCGLKTAHIARPNERGPGKGEARPSVPVDHAARDLADLAAILGA